MRRSVFALGLLLGCAEGLPDPSLVVEHRVLASRLEVDATDADPSVASRAEVLPGESLSITPFVVGPTGVVDPSTLDAVWIACELAPGQAPFACLPASFPITLEDLPACATATGEAAWANPTVGRSPCLIGRGGGSTTHAVVASQTVVDGAALELTFIAGAPDGTPTDDCGSELLAGEYDVPDDCLYGVQVAPVGPAAALATAAEAHGFTAPLQPLAPANTDVPDTNPTIVSVRVTVLDDAAEVVVPAREVGPGETLDARMGQVLRIDTRSPVGDLQPFAIPAGDGSWTESSERYRGAWLSTWGRLLSTVSNDPESYDEWELVPPEDVDAPRPPGGVAHLYYVVRDGRAGVAWWWISVRVAE